MNTVTAEIDVTKPAGRKLVRELENKRCVKLQFPNPEISGVWHDWEDVIEKSFDKLSNHYGVNMRALSRNYFKYCKK